MKRKWVALAVLALASGRAASAQQSLEVLHEWTSGSEAAALNVLKSSAERHGVRWHDMPLAGQGSEATMALLQARVKAGNPPAAAHLLGFDIADLARQGALTDLDDVAAREGWDKVVPPALQQFSKSGGKWVAVPMTVHSTNWLWVNKAVLDKAGVVKVPVSWEEFVSALDRVQKSGVVALAHGGQPWQDATLFDGVVMSTGGIEFYRKALVLRDKAALGSETMRRAFDRMSLLRSYVDKDYGGRDWRAASAMVVGGKAGFQVMGDWAKGEFVGARKVPGKDFLCLRFPGTQGMVSFNADQFVMFSAVAGDKSAAQKKLASEVMDPGLQSAFNVIKGAAPARTDVPNTAFDDCGKKGMADLAEASSKNTLVGSMAHGHAVPAAVKLAFYGVITRHFNGLIDSKAAVKELVAAAGK
jgi:glucose/mannose transport system substrate-binding protein